MLGNSRDRMACRFIGDYGLLVSHKGIKQPLKRLQLDYADLVYRHRWEVFKYTETRISRKRVASPLVRPSVDQAEYNPIKRSNVEFEYVDLYRSRKVQCVD
ncbi:hypothetical protein L917_00403 [Phytophthora nicotianae]|uniref:Uncharacterized protein n=1 Tax=Phytophthora nicotianae TaxID=4792 RepID=W2M118_PHYNI|nr:hypothetical protein L917_00403 [Phytophthora nicotianae]